MESPARARLALLAALALLLSSADPGCAASWGRIANPERRGEWPFSALFFAGPPNPRSLPLYTRHPLNADQADWSSEADIDSVLAEMVEVGLNVIKLSYWGHEGETEAWAPALLFSRTRWPADASGSPTGTYTEAEQVERARQLFRKAAEHGLLVAPLLEVSPRFPFWQQFPTDLSGLLQRSGWLLRHFGSEPSWLRLYDRDGQPRHALWLIETIHGGPVDPEEFASGFDRAAEALRKQTGLRVGFIIDPTPLPPYGSHFGPEPEALASRASVLAVNPFNITSQGAAHHADPTRIPESDRLAYAESVLRKWSPSRLPLQAPLMPGYDAHIVFPRAAVYGHNSAWRERQTELALRYATGGASFDCWNGWTEGYAIPPSREEGDTNKRWARDALARLKARLEGDVDGDGRVTVADALAIFRVVAGLKTAPDGEGVAPDLDGDRAITALDGLRILRRLAGLCAVGTKP